MANKKTIANYILIGVLAVCLIGLSIYTIFSENQKEAYALQIENRGNDAFYELVSDMDSLEGMIAKLSVSGDTEYLNLLLMDIWRQTGTIQMAIEQLPIDSQQSLRLSQFINRTGDYARQLAIQVSQGTNLSESDLEQISQLQTSYSNLNDHITQIWEDGFTFDIDLDLEKLDNGEDLQGTLDFTNQQYPRLTYDGPFSESTENKEPNNLGTLIYSEQKAKKQAADFMGIKEDALETQMPVEGNLPSYVFTGKSGETTFTIWITKTGGKVLSYMQDMSSEGLTARPSDTKYTKLEQSALEFLEEKKYPTCEANYAQFYNGCAVINMVPTVRHSGYDVKLYPDLIKVWVDIETEQVVGLDATNYFMSGAQRTLPDLTVELQEAETLVNKNLTIENRALALIPTEGQEEILCYEFMGTSGENEFLVYINVQTGKLEDVLIIQHTNEGTLVR